MTLNERVVRILHFNWHDREAVRIFAEISNALILQGASTTLTPTVADTHKQWILDVLRLATLTKDGGYVTVDYNLRQRALALLQNQPSAPASKWMFQFLAQVDTTTLTITPAHRAALLPLLIEWKELNDVYCAWRTACDALLADDPQSAQPTQSTQRNPPKETGIPMALSALVLAIMIDGDLQATIAHGSNALLEDIDDNISSRDASDSLSDPSGPGLWLWTGDMVGVGYDDVNYEGTYRELTAEDLTKIKAGTPLWIDDPSDADDQD